MIAAHPTTIVPAAPIQNLKPQQRQIVSDINQIKIK
jgi:hypothetical protein